MVILILLSVFVPLLRLVLLLEIGTYLLILLSAALNLALKKDDLSLIIGFPLAVATMHITWGSALLWSLIGR
jgi:hypothetical protein